MIKKLIYIILFINCIQVNAQSDVDVVDIFKLELFLDKKNTLHSSTRSIVKNDSLYTAFKKFINLKIGKLEIDSKLYDFIDPFLYYKVDLKDLTENTSNEDSDIQSLSLFHGLQTVYILAMNSETGLVYRLKGFNGNDFLSYLRDIREIHVKRTDRIISNNKFLRNYKVYEIDFKCLYKGLKSKDINIDKYPCLARCSDPIQIE